MKTIGLNNVIVSDFMTTGLGLRGNELILYAIIYGFTQDGEFHSVRISYIQNWISLTHQGLTWLIGDLKKKGLIEIQKRGRTNWYRILEGPIEEYAKKVAKETQETEKKKERGPSPWEKALEKARKEEGIEGTEDKEERLKKIAEAARSYDPYADDEEEES